MKSLFKSALILMLIPCLLFAGCTKNILLTVYYIADGVITHKQVKADEFSSGTVIELLKEKGVIPDETVLLDFKNEGSDTYRSLTVDFADSFRVYLSSQTQDMQKLIMQAMANTFLHNFKADSINFTVEGKVIRTGIYDFSEAFILSASGITADEISIKATPTPEPTPTPTFEPTPEPTPESTPNETPITVVTPTATAKVPSGKKVVAMTFDDGPHSKYTKLLADVCKKYNAGATFFVIGNRVTDTTGPMLKYAQDKGCEIAIHGYTHEVYYDKCSEERFNEELSKTAEVIKKYTGKAPTMMRPVGGRITDARVKSCPYAVIQWNVDSEDWRHKKAGVQEEIDIIVNNVMNTVGPGKIILMHEIYGNSYEAFKIIIEKLYAQGYEVVTVTELLGKENVKPGIEIFSR